MANVLMLGLEDTLARSLEAVLSDAGHFIWRAPVPKTWDNRLYAEIVFVPGGHLQLVRAIRALENAPPVVVVTRLPDTAEWLDALEAGAADYCSEPFESVQIRWVLESALKRPKAFAA